jgi:hypothetical protein
MTVFRVPYPRDPARRQVLFEKAADLMSRHGSYEGTPEAGTFRGSTPLGRFAGTYRSLDESEEMEFEIQKKPLLIPMGMIEHQTRKFMSEAGDSENRED